MRDEREKWKFIIAFILQEEEEGGGNERRWNMSYLRVHVWQNCCNIFSNACQKGGLKYFYNPSQRSFSHISSYPFKIISFLSLWGKDTTITMHTKTCEQEGRSVKSINYWDGSMGIFWFCFSSPEKSFIWLNVTSLHTHTNSPSSQLSIKFVSFFAAC